MEEIDIQNCTSQPGGISSLRIRSYIASPKMTIVSNQVIVSSFNLQDILWWSGSGDDGVVVVEVVVEVVVVVKDVSGTHLNGYQCPIHLNPILIGLARSNPFMDVDGFKGALNGFNWMGS